MIEQCKFHNFPTSLIEFPTCIANSRVGTKISPCPLFLTTFSIMGIPKANVLPVPVCAMPITFLPFNARGIISF